MPTGTSVASLRGKAFFWTVFGMATMPTSTTEPSLRGEGGGLLTGLWHGDPAHKYSRANPAWQRVLLTGLWHGDPAHKCSRANPAWQRVLLTGLRHGDPAHRYFWGTVACRREGNRYC